MNEETETLERTIRELKAHISSLSEALKTEQSKGVRLGAQVQIAKESAILRINQAKTLIDNLHDRIELMVDEWQAQIFENFKCDEAEKKRLIALVEPFRPLRISGAVVESEKPSKETSPQGSPQETQKEKRVPDIGKLPPP